MKIGLNVCIASASSSSSSSSSPASVISSLYRLRFL